MVTPSLTNDQPRPVQSWFSACLKDVEAAVQRQLRTRESKMFKECRLFRARDFVSLLGPCFLLCRFYGLFPYKITSNNREIVHCKWRLVCSLMIMLTYVLTLACFVYQINLNVILRYISVPGLLQMQCYIFLSALIGFISMLYTKSKLKFLQQLNVVSSTLPEETFLRMSRVVHAKDILGFLILFTQAPNIYSQSNFEILSKFIGFYSTLMVYALDMLYVDCVYVLYAGFTSVNQNLHGLRNYVITEKPHLLRRVYHKYHNPIILLELKALKEKHHALSEAVQQSNNVFGFHIGTTVVLTFTEVTFSLYFHILRQFGDVELDLKDQTWYSNFIMSVMYHSLKFVAIIWICEATKNVALQTGNLVHEMLIRIDDFDVKHELQLFSLQLLHRNNTFNARGIVVDATLLKDIVGGIATYLLILIQFLLSSKK